MARYDAFISYSHDADGTLAPSLQTGLQRLARTWRKRRALEVFRDRTGLAVTPHLWGEITVALANSRWLVLMASPDSAQSVWVNQEIEFFLAADPTARDRILPVVTGGEWTWAGDGRFTAESTAVPHALVGVFDEEPLYLDLRWAKDRENLSLHDPVFRAAVADVAAPIHGRSKDELIGEDVHQFRLARRMRRAAVGGLAVLTVAALVASVVAVANGREAVEQRDFARSETERAETQQALAVKEAERAEAEATRANQKAAEARSRELAASALALKDDDPAVAALLAVDSLYPNGADAMLESPEAVNAVGVTSRALLSQVFVRTQSLSDSTDQAIVATADGFVATVGPAADTGCWPSFVSGVGVSTPIVWWDRASGDRLSGPPAGVSLSPHYVNMDWGVLRIDDARTATPLVGTGENCLALSGVEENISAPLGLPACYDAASGLMVAFEQATGQFVTIDPVTGSEVARATPPAGEFAWSDVVVSNAVVVAAHFDGVRIWGLQSGGETGALDFTGTRLAAEGSKVFYGESVAEFDFTGGPTAVELDGVFDFVGNAEFSRGARFLALTDGSCACRVSVWDLSRGQVSPVATVSSPAVSSMRWVDDELVVTTTRGVEFYEFREPSELRDVDAKVSADGSTLVVVHTLTGQLEVVDLSRPEAGPGQPLDAVPSGYGFQVSGDGRLIALPGATLSVIDATTGEVVFTAPQSYGELDFDPSGRAMALTTYDPVDARDVQVDVYDTRTWEVVASLSGGVEELYGLQWVSETQLLAAPVEGAFTRFTVGDGSITAESLSTWRGAVRQWSSADGEVLAAADETGRVQLLAGLATDSPGAPLSELLDAGSTSVGEVSFSADGQRMITVSGPSITLWNISDRTDPRRVERLEILPLLVAVDSARGFRTQTWFSPDGESILMELGGVVVELADFDPARVCANVSESDLLRAEDILGDESACRRIAALA